MYFNLLSFKTFTLHCVFVLIHFVTLVEKLQPERIDTAMFIDLYANQ